MIINDSIKFDTYGKNEIVNITKDIERKIELSGISKGSVLIFVPGATGAVSTVEYEPGLLHDIPEFYNTIIPENRNYQHNERWQDGNGHSHIRATLTGPSLIIPINNMRMILGTWQQVVFMEFDNKPHKRKIIIQISGE